VAFLLLLGRLENLMTRTILLGLVVLASAALTTASAPDTPKTPDNIAGVYKCEGSNPDGTAYQGVVEIAKVQDTFRVRWTLSDNASVVGIGILSGGVFSVSYFAGVPAIVVYKLDGTKLVGEWTTGGAEGAVYRETLTRIEGAEPDQPEPRRPRPPRTNPANRREA
jgi:hypothetical protein